MISDGCYKLHNSRAYVGTPVMKSGRASSHVADGCSIRTLSGTELNPQSNAEALRVHLIRLDLSLSTL